MEALDWQGWLTIGVIGLLLVGMVKGIAAPDLILMTGLFVLGATGVLTPEETFSGFANPAMATVGALFILSAAMRETGALEITLGRLFGRSKSELAGMLRTLPVLAGLSAFLNNAPIVAMMTPLVMDWCRRNRISPSRFLIPLSYSTILGSIVTVIGTSVTLTVAGLVTQSGMEPLSLFELAPAFHMGALEFKGLFVEVLALFLPATLLLGLPFLLVPVHLVSAPVGPVPLHLLVQSPELLLELFVSLLLPPFQLLALDFEHLVG